VCGNKTKQKTHQHQKPSHMLISWAYLLRGPRSSTPAVQSVLGVQSTSQGNEQPTEQNKEIFRLSKNTVQVITLVCRVWQTICCPNRGMNSKPLNAVPKYGYLHWLLPIWGWFCCRRKRHKPQPVMNNENRVYSTNKCVQKAHRGIK
jgi:hypothetical protein